MQASLTVKSTVHEAWAAIKKVRLGVDHVKEANTERLRQEFGEITFNSGESVDDFFLCFNMIASPLRALGEDVTNKEVIKWLLHSIPEKLEQVVISMETLLDLGSLSIKEAVSHLCDVEQRKKPAPAKESSGRLLLTEEEWMA
jgi:hypothetical protein